MDILEIKGVKCFITMVAILLIFTRLIYTKGEMTLYHITKSLKLVNYYKFKDKCGDKKLFL